MMEYHRIKDATEKGKIEGKIEIAKKLLEIGLPIEDIMRVTELNREEIEHL